MQKLMRKSAYNGQLLSQRDSQKSPLDKRTIKRDESHTSMNFINKKTNSSL